MVLLKGQLLTMIDYSTIFNSQNIFYWILIGGILLFLTYSMIIIKNEKKTYLKNAKIYNFHQFQLKVPTWWTELPVEVKNLIQFERTDTRYDWKAFFQILNQPLGKYSKVSLFIKFIVSLDAGQHTDKTSDTDNKLFKSS